MSFYCVFLFLKIVNGIESQTSFARLSLDVWLGSEYVSGSLLIHLTLMLPSSWDDIIDW